MPNQRRKDKRPVHFWFTPKEKEILQRAADKMSEIKRRKCNMADFVRLAIVELSSRYGINNGEEGNG